MGGRGDWNGLWLSGILTGLFGDVRSGVQKLFGGVAGQECPGYVFVLGIIDGCFEFPAAEFE